MRKKRNREEKSPINDLDHPKRRKTSKNVEHNCVICLQPALENTVSMPCCNHILHAKCISCLRSSNGRIRCPLCRSDCTDVQFQLNISEDTAKEIIQSQWEMFDKHINEAFQKTVSPMLVKHLIGFVKKRYSDDHQTVQKSFKLRVHIENLNEKIKRPVPVLVWLY